MAGTIERLVKANRVEKNITLSAKSTSQAYIVGPPSLARLRAALLLLIIVCALALTWTLAGRTWAVQATIGGADSALLGPGFYTKEQTAEGVPFRWTSGPAVFRVPYLRSDLIISFRADTATGQPYTLKILDQQRRVATIDVQPGFHTYHILWPSAVRQSWPGGLGAREITLLAEARALNDGDDRLYGIAVSEFAAREVRQQVPVAALLCVAITLGALTFLLRPIGEWHTAKRQIALFALLAFTLPVAFDLLAWHPPVGDNHTWLPLSWLPWFIALLASGAALARLATSGTAHGASVACALVGLVFVGLLATLQVIWQVEGPDYGWHLNHGGSWERVFRAHRFHPFGFPLILYLGQLAGDRALLFGRATALLSTLIVFGATVALVWRMLGRSYAWLGAVVLLAAPTVVAYGVLASTDAPMAACMALALLALCWHEQPGWRPTAFGGALIGIGYLFRFQAIVLLVPVAVWLLTQPRVALPIRLTWIQRTGRLALALVLVGAFVLATAPQWLLDIRDFGRPFFTAQYVNIWTFAFNKQDGPPDGSPVQQLWYILNYDPSMLWHHWATNLRQATSETLNNLLIWPLGVLALAGAASSLLAMRDRRYGLLALWLAAYVLVVALTANKERFFLPVMPILVVFVVVPLVQLNQRLQAFPRVQRLAYGGTCAALWCWAMLHLLEAERELVLYLVP